jgi:GNAT superfamily N-acetyltransferase
VTLRLTRFSPADDAPVGVRAFLDAAFDALMANEIGNNIMLGFCQMLRDGAAFTVPPYLAVVRDEHGQIAGVAARFGGHVVTLGCDTDPAALPLFAADLYDRYGTQVPGVLGPVDRAAAFVREWEALTGIAPRSRTQERLYRLERVNPVSGVPGVMRPYTPSERELVIDWMLAFEDEINMAVQRVTRAEMGEILDRRVSGDPRSRGLHLWWADGQPVSMAGHAGATPHSIRINAVYTPPEQRGRGYASALVAALSQEMLDSGYQWTTLYTDLANPTSNRIYQAIGYQPVMDVDMYRFNVGE